MTCYRLGCSRSSKMLLSAKDCGWKWKIFLSAYNISLKHFENNSCIEIKFAFRFAVVFVINKNPNCRLSVGTHLQETNYFFYFF